MSLFFCVACVLALGACGSGDSSDDSPEGPSAGKTVIIESVAVQSGLIEEDGEVALHVRLPASYADSDDGTYPVVYCLHGFGDDPRQMADTLALALADDSAPEAILVAVDGTNRLGGSFYANSAATGDWEDLVVDEVVAYMDSHYRTETSAARRMLAGFSMGGFAAWNIALAHPDVFGSAWACCPGAWDANGLSDTLAMWDGVYRNAYGAAFSPDTDGPYPYAGIPRQTGTPEDSAIAADWERGFGGIDEKLEAYLAGTGRLVAIRFAYASSDEYRWIPNGTRFVAGRMKDAGLPAEIGEFSGNHRMSDSMIGESFVPFVHTVFN